MVRWLRPEFQNVMATQAGFDVEIEEEVPVGRAGRNPWPPSLPERVSAVRNFLLKTPAPVPQDLSTRTHLAFGW